MEDVIWQRASIQDSNEFYTDVPLTVENPNFLYNTQNKNNNNLTEVINDKDNNESLCSRCLSVCSCLFIRNIPKLACEENVNQNNNNCQILTTQPIPPKRRLLKLNEKERHELLENLSEFYLRPSSFTQTKSSLSSIITGLSQDLDDNADDELSGDNRMDLYRKSLQLLSSRVCWGGQKTVVSSLSSGFNTTDSNETNRIIDEAILNLNISLSEISTCNSSILDPEAIQGDSNPPINS